MIWYLSAIFSAIMSLCVHYDISEQNLPVKTYSSQKSNTICIKCQPSAEIELNDTLIIEFRQYPGRAYSWSMMTADTSLKFLKLLKISSHDLGNMPDSPESVKFIFLGKEKGVEQLNFSYYRPWESSRKAVDSCKISIRIK